MFLIDAIKPYVDKKSKTVFVFFRQLFRGGESGVYKIKPGRFFPCYSTEMRNINTTHNF